MKKQQRPKRPPRGNRAAREAARWDDPDDSDGEGDAEEEYFHPQTDRGLGGEEDDESGEDLRGSDSEADGETAADDPLLAASAGRRRAAPKKRGGDADEGLWNPLAGLRPRKRSRPAPGEARPAQGRPGSAPQPAKGGASMPEGGAVCLFGLVKAPQLNGQLGTVAGPVDWATGRCPVLLASGAVKSLKPENLKKVLTGSVVRLKGLQAAAELNGALAECGQLDLATERYSVTLADGKETLKKVKEANLDLVGRHLSPGRLLSAPADKRPLAFVDAVRRGAESERRPWKAQLELLAELGLPAPRLLEGASLAASPSKPRAVAADALPVAAHGILACRLLAVSTERDACCPAKAREEELRRLGQAAKALSSRASGDAAEIFFLVPGDCTEPLPCLRGSASCAWPLWLQLCQALVCLETEHRAHKSWCRAEELMTSQVLSKPIYLLGQRGVSAPAPGTSGDRAGGGWLLSDRAETLEVGPPADGQALPAERQLLARVCEELLPGKGRSGAKLTCYRL